ncbi:unnamed protein product [Effrenium voratum]|nr:unnamed protein product [Effrenium voratum]
MALSIGLRPIGNLAFTPPVRPGGRRSAAALGCGPALLVPSAVLGLALARGGARGYRYRLMAGPAKPVEPAVLRQLGQETLEAIARVTASVPTRGVWKDLEPGELAQQFETSAPEEPRDYGQILQKLEAQVFPGALSWQHPKFMAYYPSSTSVPAILAETVIASIGSVGLQWKSNPIGTELEVVVMDWVAKFLGIGPAFHHSSQVGGGIIQNTAGESMLNIMICARVRAHRRANPELSREEAFYQDSSKMVAYLSDQAHFSAEKACRLAGLRVRKVAARLEGNYTLNPSDVKAAMEKDRAAGLQPTALILTYGSTNTSGCDDVKAFKDLAEDDLWIHVDAAYAGAAWSLDQFRQDAQAVSEVVTSVNMNGSKWFLCGFDSAFLWVRDRKLLLDVFSASGVFMADVEDMSIYNPEFKDWSVPLGRRFRALRIWMVFEYFGTSGLKSYIRQAVDQASWLRSKIEESEHFEQPVQTVFGLVCLRSVHGDEVTRQLAAHLAAQGYGLAPTKIADRDALRVALGATSTTQADVEKLWSDMCEFAEAGSNKRQKR